MCGQCGGGTKSTRQLLPLLISDLIRLINHLKTLDGGSGQPCSVLSQRGTHTAPDIASPSYMIIYDRLEFADQFFRLAKTDSNVAHTSCIICDLQTGRLASFDPVMNHLDRLIAHQLFEVWLAGWR